MSDDGVNDASPAAPVDAEPVAVGNVLFNTSISFDEAQQAVRESDVVAEDVESQPEAVKSIDVPAPQSQIVPNSTVTNRHVSRMSRNDSIKSRHGSILSERTLLGNMDDDDLEVSQEHLVDSPFFWHQPKSEHDFDNWPQYADQVTDLRDIGVSQVAIDEAYLAGSPTFAEIDDDSFESINLQNLRREYYQESMEFKPNSEALRALDKWEDTYRDAVDSLTGQEYKDARKIWVGSKNLFEGHLKSTTPTLWLLFDIFPGFLHPLIMKFSKWKPRVARNMENQPISGPRNMLDLLAFGNLIAVFTILGFAVPIWSSMGTRLDDTPLLTAQQCAYMSPSVSAKSFATPGQFLMNRSWSMDMFATVGVISGFSPVGDYFSKEWKAANMTMPTMKSCVISTPFSLKLDADAKPNAIVEQGGYRMNTGVPLVFNISGFAMGSLQKNISSCVSYNDMKIGSPYVNSKRGLTDVILVTVLYVLCFVIIGYNIYQSKTMAVAFQNRSILIDTRNTIQVYGQTYRWEIVAIIYLICMFAFTAVSEVYVFVPYSAANDNPAISGPNSGPCGNFYKGSFNNHNCMLCNGLEQPVAVYYSKTYTEGFSSAFNQTTVIALALFKICSILLSKYAFISGDSLVGPNSRHSPYRNIHKLRHRLITMEQATDYLYALFERRLDWCLRQPAFAPAMAKVGDASQQKPPRKEIKLKYYYTLSEAREISKNTYEADSLLTTIKSYCLPDFRY